MLLDRGKQIETCLVCHSLLLVLDLQPVTDGFVKGHGLFLDTEAMRVDVFYHTHSREQVQFLRSNGLWVARFKCFCEVFELGLEVDLQLSCTCGVHRLLASWLLSSCSGTSRRGPYGVS